MRVIKDRQSHAAIELDPSSRLLLRLGEENSLVLQEHPQTWFEIVAGQGRIEYNYDTYWRVLTQPNGEPYSPCEALRKMMRGTVGAPAAFGPGVIDAVLEYLPHGEVHLFGWTGSSFEAIGHCCCEEDAAMIAKALEVKPVIFSTFEEFCRLPAERQTEVALAVGAKDEATTKEIFDMASVAKRKKMQQPGTKTKTALGRQKPGPSRADGPVAKARAIFEKFGGKDTAAIREACVKAGINSGTTSVQLGKWRKEHGVVVERGPKKSAAAKKKTSPKVKIDSVANAKPKKTKKKAKKVAMPVTPAAIPEGGDSPADHGKEYISGLKATRGGAGKKPKGNASDAPPVESGARAADQAPGSATTVAPSDDIPF